MGFKKLWWGGGGSGGGVCVCVCMYVLGGMVRKAVLQTSPFSSSKSLECLGE